MDTLFYNAKFYTLNPERPVAEVIGVTDGKISFTGAYADGIALAADEAELVNLGGKCVLPGFNDSHMHLLGCASAGNTLNLFNITSIDEGIELGKEYLKSKPDTRWLIARGWNNEKFSASRFFNKFDLDKISTDIPVIYTRVCGHIAVVNGKALKIILNLPKSKELMSLIDIETGVLKENAAGLHLNAIKPYSREEIEELLLTGAKMLNKAGITSVQTDDFTALPVENCMVIADAYRNLAKRVEDSITVRVAEQASFNNVQEMEKFVASIADFGGNDELFRLSAIKIFQDGSLGGKTALLREPYADWSSNTGVAVNTQDELDYMVCLCHNNDLRTAIHSIGDKAAEMALEAIEKANAKNPKPHLRHGIVHAQITDEALITRIKKAGVIVYAQPVFVSTDMDTADQLLGKGRAEKTYQWKTMIDAGVHVSGGSDAPVESFSILENIYCAVTREKLGGGPDNGWNPQEKLTIDEAVRMFTIEGAYASREENIKGMLVEGMLCDMVVLSEDIFACPLSHIKDIRVEKTIMGGKIVFES